MRVLLCGFLLGGGGRWRLSLPGLRGTVCRSICSRTLFFRFLRIVCGCLCWIRWGGALRRRLSAIEYRETYVRNIRNNKSLPFYCCLCFVQQDLLSKHKLWLLVSFSFIYRFIKTCITGYQYRGTKAADGWVIGKIGTIFPFANVYDQVSKASPSGSCRSES